MEYSDRELLVYRIRSGVLSVNYDGKILRVYPPTIQQYLDSCEEYSRVYDECRAEGIKTQDEMCEWMMEQDLWSFYEEKQINEIKKKLEDIKLSCYQNRRNQIHVNSHKNQIRSLERTFIHLNDLKYKYFSSTCDGIASNAKTTFLIKNTCLCEGLPYIFDTEDSINIQSLVVDYNYFHNIEDEIIRFLSREEPWKTIWATREHTTSPLFSNNDEQDLTMNQKSILAWSQMYDNVYESMDCPDKYVIEDDDLLDGWFISQARSREKDKAKNDLEKTISSSKIRNAQEVYSVVRSKEEYEKIEMLNNPYSKMIKKQRTDLINKKGGVGQGAFEDEKIKYVAQQNKQFSGKFGGK